MEVLEDMLETRGKTVDDFIFYFGLLLLQIFEV